MTDRWGAQPTGFNRSAAETVFKAMTSLDDDGAAVLGRVLTMAVLEHQLIHDAPDAAAELNKRAEQQIVALRRQLARSAVAKSRGGEDSTEDLQALAVVVKAFDYTEAQRQDYARRQQRDLQSGRFARMHQKIGYEGGTKPLKPEMARAYGIEHAGGLKGEDRARFQQAYLQVRDLIAPYTGMGDSALLHLHVDTPGGERKVRTTTLPDHAANLSIKDHVQAGDRIHAATVSVAPPMTASGAAYDFFAAQGRPGVGGAAAGAVENGVGNPDRLREYREAQSRTFAQDEFIPSQRVFRGIENSSKLLRDSLGDNAPKKVQYALAVGEHVGRLGPEAQKVIGPAADKAAYRFRGTERAVSSALGNALLSIRGDARLKSGTERREFMLHGVETDAGWAPSGVLAYFRRQLPKADLNTLQLASGVVPPSRGVVIDRHGKVAAESVGFGDDHYLPFNLTGHAFRGLRGGEYVRTRTYGGPTTEDIYAGLMSGARGLTVVSHNGVYTIDFSHDLRGGRRFNDKATRMVARYGYLLDAVRSGQVQTGGVHPSRMEELRAKAGKLYDEDDEPEAYSRELTRLTNREKKRPELSEAQKAEATLDFFNTQAAKLSDGSTQVTNPDELVGAYVSQMSNKRWLMAVQHAKAAGATPPSREPFETAVRQELQGQSAVETGRKVAQALNMEHGLDAALRRAETENRARVNPLRLNGEGYKTALDALQEQFPQYIARVEFHQWDGAAKAEDTGYVRPGRNRAADAMAGFFDPLSGMGARREGGGGKVYADSIRWQNRDNPRPVKSERRGEDAKDGAARGAGGRARSPMSEENASVLRREADHALFDQLKEDTVGQKVVALGGATPEALRGGSLRGFLADTEGRKALTAAAPELFKLRDMTKEQFAEAYDADPAKMRGRLTTARNEVQQTGLLDVAPQVLRNFDSGGAPAAAKALPKRTSDALDRLTQDHEFENAPAAYDSYSNPSTEQVANAYEADSRIGALVSAGRLPERVDDDRFADAAQAVHEQLTRARSALLARVREGENVPERDWGPVDKGAEALLRATQLRRRHEQAARREVTHAAAADEDLAATVQQLGIHMPPPAPDQSPEEYAEYVRAALDAAQATQENPDLARRWGLTDGRTIEG